MRWRLDPGQIEVVDEAVAEVLRSKKPWERVAMALSANRTLRLLVEAAVRNRHPGWDDAVVIREVARRMSGGAV